MRFLVVVVSAGAALTLIAASGLMNWVFMTSLGKSEFEQQILGAVSVAVSAFLALLPTLLLWAYRERRTLYVGPWRAGVSRLCGVLAFLGRRLCRQEPRQLERRPRARPTRLAASSASIAEAESKAESARRFKAVPPSFRKLCAGLEQDRRWQSLEILHGRDRRCVALLLQRLFRTEGGSCPRERSRAYEEQHRGPQERSPQLEEQGAGRRSRQSGGCAGAASSACRRRKSSAHSCSSSRCWSRWARHLASISQRDTCAPRAPAMRRGAGG